MPAPIELSTLDKIQALEAKLAKKDETRSRTLQRLATALGETLSPVRLWSSAYMHQAISGKIKSSKFLEIAVARLYAKLFFKKDPTKSTSKKMPDTYVPFKSLRERAHVMRVVPPDQRRNALVKLASKARKV